MKKKIESILERGLKLFQIRTFNQEEIKWYHELFLDLHYDKDTNLIYSLGLNILPALLLVIALLACGIMIL